MKQPSLTWSRRLASRLAGWFRATDRRLPWRGTRDPYSILVSEVMLQQTTVKAVIPYYRSFLALFPDWESLAAAREDAVLAAWSGLGYYARARNLQAAARMILELEGGEFPRDLRRARDLPGVGHYTAGAVLSIAYDVPTPAIDGNAARVLARLCGETGDIRVGEPRRRLIAHAESLLRNEPPSVVNQALMDLGALVCSPAAPLCGECPLRQDCFAANSGQALRIPKITPRPQSIDVVSSLVAIRRRGRFLVVRRGEGELMGRLWEFPGTVADDLERARRSTRRSNGLRSDRERGSRKREIGRRIERPDKLKRHLARRFGFHVQIEERLGEIRHTVTFRRIRATIFAARLMAPPQPRSCRWRTLEEIKRLPAGSITRKIVRLLEESREPGKRSTDGAAAR